MQIYSLNSIHQYLFTIEDGQGKKHAMPLPTKIMTIAIAIIVTIPALGLETIATGLGFAVAALSAFSICVLSKYLLQLSVVEGTKEVAKKALPKAAVPVPDEHKFPDGVSFDVKSPLLQNYEGTYDFNVQISKIKHLKQEGKTLRLIVGRGNAEQFTSHELKELENTAWVYTSYWSEGLSSKDPKPHIWADLNDTAHLDAITAHLSNTFEEICLDMATWNWISEREQVLNCFFKILKPNGVLKLPEVIAKIVRPAAEIPSEIEKKLPSKIYGTTTEEVDLAAKDVRNKTLNYLATLFGEAKYLEEGDNYPLVGISKVSYFQATKVQPIESSV